MHFFSRKHKQQPQPTDPHNCETALMPIPATTIIPAIESVKTLPVPTVLLQHCAYCGLVGATHPFGIGDFYLGKLKYPRLCDACYAERTRKEALHHLAQRKTSVEVPVAMIRKRAVLEAERL